MRRIREAVLPFVWNNDDLPKTVREYREKYKGVSRILDDHPEILELVHRDLKRLSCGGPHGREGDFTSETVLRALVVHAIEGLSLRETVVRIAESEFLQDFLRSRKKAVMDHTFLDRCFQAVRPATWKQINAILAQRAVKSGIDRRFHDPQRHHGDRDEHPLADGCVAVVGYLAGGGPAVASGAGPGAGNLPAPLP